MQKSSNVRVYRCVKRMVEVLLIQNAEKNLECNEMHCTKSRSNRTEERYVQERWEMMERTWKLAGLANS
jgi:hypothetical protein